MGSGSAHRSAPKDRLPGDSGSDKGFRQTQQGHAARVEDLAGPEQGTLAGQTAVVDEDGGIDRAVQDSGAQAGEQGAAVEQDQVELASQTGHQARPGGTGQEVAGTGDRGAERQDREVVVGGVDQGISQRQARLDHVVQSHLGTQAELAGEHRTGQVGIDEQGSAGSSGQGTGERQDERRPALGAVAAREQKDLDLLSVADRDQVLGQRLESLAVGPFEGADGLRPVEQGGGDSSMAQVRPGS